MTRTRRPSRSSAAATPARASDDFPLPDAPTIATAPAGVEVAQAGLDVRLPTEERPGVADVIGHQPRVGTVGAGLGEDRPHGERLVLAEDRLLERD